jgi:hypothetical protein
MDGGNNGARVPPRSSYCYSAHQPKALVPHEGTDVITNTEKYARAGSVRVRLEGGRSKYGNCFCIGAVALLHVDRDVVSDGVV